MKRINHDKTMGFTVHGRAEYINNKTIKLFSQCNINFVKIGLQSLNQTALQNVHRWSNKKLFMQGLRLLKKANIPFRLDAILGLPGDSIASINKMVEFVKRHNGSEINYFGILRLPPEAPIRRQAKKFRLKYLRKIPYYILSTDTLTHRALRKLSKVCGENRNSHLSSQNKNYQKEIPIQKFPFLPQPDYREKSRNVFKM